MMSLENHSVPRLKNQGDCKVSLLDLPDELVDCILKCLSPQDLFRVAQVCTHLRNISRRDHLWEKHVEQKWSRLLGNDAYHEWEYHTTKYKELLVDRNLSDSLGTTSGNSSFQRIHSYLRINRSMTDLIKNHSKMALYIFLETGRFWFPAQVYKATLLTLHCYDAIVSYDSRTDTFQTRCPYGRKRLIERDISWDMLRMPPPKTYLVDYYEYNDLNNLKPGDHIEIQKRGRRLFPIYDWAHAVVCHLESCDQDVNHCSCKDSDILVMGFSRCNFHLEYSLSKSTKHAEAYREFNFLNGIRKLDEEEIEKWNNVILTRNNRLAPIE
ncbi:F-box protein At2g26850 [Medicago truncatula]|nr:F-box protein At2g26850-like [Medicago truncatula]AES81202.2 F-box plant-like protein [Medicago truncatula]